MERFSLFGTRPRGLRPHQELRVRPATEISRVKLRRPRGSGLGRNYRPRERAAAATGFTHPSSAPVATGSSRVTPHPSSAWAAKWLIHGNEPGSILRDKLSRVQSASSRAASPCLGEKWQFDSPSAVEAPLARSDAAYQASDNFSTTSFRTSTREQNSQRCLSGSMDSL